MGSLNTLIEPAFVDQNVKVNRSPHTRATKLNTTKKTTLGKPLTVGRLLEAVPSSSEPAILLGQCHDQRPFLLQLDEPELGAILISGERGCGKTHHLQVMAESAIFMNSPSRLQISVLTFKPNEWDSLITREANKKYFQGVFAWYDPWAEDFISTLYNLAHERRKGNQKGVNVLLLLDDFNFLEEMSLEAQFNLHWLLEYGAQFGVWVSAAINGSYVDKFQFWTNCFRTRIIGKTTSDTSFTNSGISRGSNADRLEHSNFLVRMQNHWMNYHLPLLGD